MQMVRKMRFRFLQARIWTEEHKEHLPTIALASGFIWDSITLGRPDQIFDNVVLLFYLVLSGVGIILLNRRRELISPEAALWQLILIQFSFGNLASALFILYSQSGTISGSWLFFLLLIGLLVGNEFFRSRYELIRFHITVYYLVLFAYFVLVIPILTRKIGVPMFLISGAASLFVVTVFIFLVYFFAPRLVRDTRKDIAISIAGVFLIFNAFYFLNLIPPVPLALKEIGVYHHVVRDLSGTYRLTYEKGAWYKFWKKSDDMLNLTLGADAYCFSSVFAPARLKTPIVHRWEYLNPATGEWQETTSVSFSIVGGRDEGFRGFSVKNNLTPGVWRCSVETPRGQLIGREKFEVVSKETDTELTTDIR